MNKDVIYIEPEDDITDILANIKNAKNKIIALVPPKKASVLRSAVNFKLMAKAAKQYEKTVVLITTDESLLRLANNVKMPTAKSLQSKPQLPDMDDAKEFGEEDTDDEIVEEKESDEGQTVPIKKTSEKAEKAEKAEKEVAEKPAHKTEKPAKKDDAKSAGAAVAKKKDVDMEVSDDDDDDSNDGVKKKNEKKAEKKVPNFKKYRVKLIIAAVVIIAIFGVGFWASVIAPAAKITVKVKTSKSNFTENVSFVTDEAAAKPEEGIFYIERKETSKKASSDFEATGEVDKGTKAAGTVNVSKTVTLKQSDFEEKDDVTISINIPKDAVFTSGGKKYVVSEGASASKTINADRDFASSSEYRKGKTFTVGPVKVTLVAEENGDSYNAAATNSWSYANCASCTYVGSAMTGGTSKMVKVVSQGDVEKAGMGLTTESDNEAREELFSQFGSEYILISSSFTSETEKTTTSPALNEEVGEGVTPKIVRENKYYVYAVKRDAVSDYIKAKVSAKLGDETQIVYSTGVIMPEDEKKSSKDAFFDAYKNADGKMGAKLKSTAKTGPRITEDMVKEVSLGEKLGKVQSNLRSYNGVADVKIDTSYPWVMNVPSDDNKVQIEITVE